MILKEAQLRKTEANEPITTVFIGGGTPSLLPAEVFSGLINGLNHIYDLNAVREFTAEANPGTVTVEWLDMAVTLGVNRISFGMQAYQDRILHLLGRIHRFEDVVSSVSLARRAGIGNISIDLIFGIPGQTISDWTQTADAALSLKPEHLSAYGLIPEEGTPLYKDLESGHFTLPDPDLERGMYDLVIRKTAEAGFHQYEISNFALAGFECEHNKGYWTQIPYIGLGVSAASMTGIRYSADGMDYHRRTNPVTLDQYENMISSGILSSADLISPADSRFETMMLGLRMNQGVEESAFLKKHRVTLEQCYGKKLRTMEKLGLCKHENGVWKLTRRGFDVQNSILVELMDD